MPRPKGAVNRIRPGMPNYDPEKNKPGRKVGSTVLSLDKVEKRNYTDAQILEYKQEILNLFITEKATTLSEAARQLGISPMRVWAWVRTDKDFYDLLELSHELIADRLEKHLVEHANFIPQMMILKGYRPIFRDNYHAPVEDSKAQEILTRLVEIATRAQKAEEQKQ